MLDKLAKDIVVAMKSKEKSKLNALRYLKSMLMENKVSKKPKPEMDVVVSHFKKLKDSIEVYPEESEQRENIKIEMSFISPYMPEQLSKADVEKIIGDIISAQENPNMGMVMKELSPAIKGKFDGKEANQIVRQLLENR